MGYLALYRKYRPSELSEVVGQDEIKQILANSIKNNTITHAYLFSGPRGTGKTTMAKILAKMVNCESPVDGNACGKCKNCLNILNSNDIIEIDAASNNGVDEIRDLREKASLVPSELKYKVYIIDEVHMLTTQAFNALLKTLEEPPRHVIFVLATTEYYKIPLTITSRCQKFQFSKLSVDNIVDKLKEISSIEKIPVEEAALYEIARISDGGMRDSINFLDQLRSFDSTKITIEDVYNVCGNISIDEIVNLLIEIRKDNVEYVNNFFEQMNNVGKNYSKFLEDFISYLKNLILFKKDVDRKLINLDDKYFNDVSPLYSFDDVFYIIDNVNLLIDRLKIVSRQSVVVISDFLLIMYELNKKSDNNDNDKESTDKSEYDMAFTFNENVEDKKQTVDKKPKIEKENLDVLNYKDVIINNTFAVANKEIKNALQEKFSNLSEYLTSSKYSVAAGILVDMNIEAAGKKYLILSGKNDALISRLYDNYRLCDELIEKVADSTYNFVAVTDNEWKKYRDEYISNIKNNKKYDLKEFDKSKLFESPKKKETAVDKLINLIGDENIEFK